MSCLIFFDFRPDRICPDGMRIFTLQGLAYEFTYNHFRKLVCTTLQKRIDLNNGFAILGAGQRCTNKLFAND